MNNENDRLPWKKWEDYEKEIISDREYARIGNRLYTRHAVERSYPASIGGRSIAPAFIEEVVRTGTVRVGRIERKIHTSGTVQIVTEDDGNIVVTVNPFSGGNRDCGIFSDRLRANWI